VLPGEELHHLVERRVDLEVESRGGVERGAGFPCCLAEVEFSDRAISVDPEDIGRMKGGNHLPTVMVKNRPSPLGDLFMTNKSSEGFSAKSDDNVWFNKVKLFLESLNRRRQQGRGDRFLAVDIEDSEVVVRGTGLYHVRDVAALSRDTSIREHLVEETA
jgi:hypothetical protein